MNSFHSYLKIKFIERNKIYIGLGILTLFIFVRFLYFCKSTFDQPNWYDLIISIFSNQLDIAYFLFVIFIFFIYNISSNKNFYKYIFLKFKNRNCWYNYNVISILIVSIVVTFFIIAQCFLEGILTLDFRNEWSKYSLFLSCNKPLIVVYEPIVFKYIINTISPLTYILINMSYMICYFFTIGLLYFLLSICFKNKVWIFIGVFFINCINIAFYRSGNYFFEKYSFYHNIILITNNNGHLDTSLFYSRYCYWIILIVSIYIIGYFIMSKKDFYFGDNV